MIGAVVASHVADSKLRDRSMRYSLALLIFVLNLGVAAGARASDADDEAKGVLGGSPPIYDGPPLIGAPQTFQLNRFIAGGRPVEPQGLQLGNRCATPIGIFGPGSKMPIGEICAGIDGHGRPVRGQVVGTGSGRFCATSQGIFGPGQEQPVGMPCRVETKTGFIQGQISGAGR
jgi:hypothetical protein